VDAVSETIRVLIVDDDALVRSGLQLMLAGAAGIDVVGEVADGRGVLAAIDRYHTDVVLMDIRMPLLDGIAATRLLRSQPRPPAVLMLTTFQEDELVLRALLSGREREVALAVGRGLANADIAGELYMSTATVKAYVSRLLTKLEVDNRVQIALLVREAEN
jgi:DNA-binding NarL/FixJ family response regulator